ncbi:MAG: hypothetical protein K9M75_10460 [Phycisphaerae bacterium]|nr:hypothetical protein [Phycisphaerae bacterium]
MKTLLYLISITAILFLSSCKEDSSQSQNTQPQQRQVKRLPQSQPPTKSEVHTHPAATVPSGGVHTVVVTEVLDTESYMYLKADENGTELWMAIQKMPIKVGDTISFENPLVMNNFHSKQLNKTFETILFVSVVKKLSDGGSTVYSPSPPANKTVEPIKVEPAEGGLTIGELFSNRKSYSDKVVRIKGKVTKFNAAIMGKNWVHLQDGTGVAGTNDLLVTTQETVNVGDVVEFEGTIALDKDFGSGYSYELLMEKGIKNSN